MTHKSKPTRLQSKHEVLYHLPTHILTWADLTAERLKRIRFTKHARDKFEFLRRYGFDISEVSVREAVATPSRVDRRGDQLLALKPLDREYAIRVVYEMANDNIVVLTFHPVKRARFNV